MLQYTNNLTDTVKDYTNPDGTPVEFRVLEPTLSVLNLPAPIEAQYIKFKIQVQYYTKLKFMILKTRVLIVVNSKFIVKPFYCKFYVQSLNSFLSFLLIFKDYNIAPCMRLEVMGCTRLECADVNECASNNGGCDQKCINRYST